MKLLIKKTPHKAGFLNYSILKINILDFVGFHHLHLTQTVE